MLVIDAISSPLNHMDKIFRSGSAMTKLHELASVYSSTDKCRIPELLRSCKAHVDNLFQNFRGKSGQVILYSTIWYVKIEILNNRLHFP